jgi:hypothetical protein
MSIQACRADDARKPSADNGIGGPEVVLDRMSDVMKTPRGLALPTSSSQ